MLIEVIFKLSFLVWPFGQFLRLNFNGQNFYLLDLVILLLFAVCIFDRRVLGHVKKSPVVKPLLIFLLISSLSLVANLYRLSGAQALKAFFYLLRLFTYPTLYFVSQTVDIKKIKPFLVAGFAIFLFYGLFQYAFYPDLRDLKYLGYDDHYYRLVGSSFDPNFTGLILVIFIVVLFAQNFYGLMFLCLVALSLTFSRASYLTLGLSILIQGFRKHLKKILLIMLLMILLILIIPKPFGEGVNLMRTFSIYSRLESTKTGLAMFFEKPLLGWGYNTLSDDQCRRVGIDNSFVYLLATTGTFGFLSFLYLLIRLFKTSDTDEIKIIYLAIFFHSLFNNSLFFIWIFFLFWLSPLLGKVRIREQKSL